MNSKKIRSLTKWAKRNAIAMRENLAVFFKEIGPAGIFTVETKTHSKPIGDARIVFDGEAIRIGGFELDRDPVIQAKAQASWLRELLTESTGRKFDVKSAIVFPGWFVDYTGPKERTVSVLTPKALPSFLDHEPARLSLEDIIISLRHSI